MALMITSAAMLAVALSPGSTPKTFETRPNVPGDA